MDEWQIEKSLRDSGLKKTAIRVAVLSHLSDCSNALSQPEFETFFKGQENRVTVYRVLRDLEEKGLIHRLYDVEGTARFALCRCCSEHAHNDEHVHFNCITCKNVFCLEDISTTIPELPEGFKIKMIHFTIEGICEKCNKN